MLKDKCINFEVSMNEVCLIVNHNSSVTKDFARLHYEAEILCYDIKPSEQLSRLTLNELDDEEYTDIINKFISNVKENVLLINQNIESFRNCLNDNDPSATINEHEDIIFDMEEIKEGKTSEEMEKDIDALIDKVREVVKTLNINREILIENITSS